ncbi:MAG: cation:proton antiporter [Caldisericaceae bacterium]
MDLFLVFGILILVALVSPFVFRRIKVPFVTGLLLFGFLFANIPSLSNYYSPYLQKVSYPVSLLCVSIILFELGFEFDRESVRAIRKTVIIIAFVESLVTFTLVFLAANFILKTTLSISLLIAIIAVPTAPDIVVFLVREIHPDEEVTKFIKDLVVIDDLIAEIAFFLVFPLLRLAPSSSSSVMLILNSSLEVIFSILFGILAGLVFTVVVTKFEKKLPNLPLIIGIILTTIGICEVLQLHTIIVMLIAGVVFANTKANKKAVMKALSDVDSVALLIFIIINGSLLSFGIFEQAHLFVVYIIIARVFGKVIGSLFGNYITKEKVLSNFAISSAMLPQSTISIFLAAHSKLYLGNQGAYIFVITMASVVFFEIIGAPLLREALHDSNKEYKS